MHKNINHYQVGESDKRPWGKWETTAVGYLSDAPEALVFCDKIITINPAQKLSTQKHHYRQEDWEIVQGSVIVFLGPMPNAMISYPMKEGDKIFIPCGHWHRIENVGSSVAIFKERQTGIYLDERDIIRLPTIDDPRGTDDSALSAIQNEVEMKGLISDWMCGEQ